MRPEEAALRSGNFIRVLKGSGKDVHSAVEAPFLDGERGLVPKARALSHYFGDTFSEKADYSNLSGRPDRLLSTGRD
jgi:hypothetical protein